MAYQNIYNALRWLEMTAPCTEVDVLIGNLDVTALDEEDAKLIRTAAATLRKACMTYYWENPREA